MFGSGTSKEDQVNYSSKEKMEKEGMVTLPVRCPSCQSDQLVRNGHTPNRKQKDRCRAWKHQSWIWIALCRSTRQVVASAVGDRSPRNMPNFFLDVRSEDLP